MVPWGLTFSAAVAHKVKFFRPEACQWLAQWTRSRREGCTHCQRIAIAGSGDVQRLQCRARIMRSECRPGTEQRGLRAQATRRPGDAPAARFRRLPAWGSPSFQALKLCNHDSRTGGKGGSKYVSFRPEVKTGKSWALIRDEGGGTCHNQLLNIHLGPICSE
jgi:hypothetical protein